MVGQNGWWQSSDCVHSVGMRGLVKPLMLSEAHIYIITSRGLDAFEIQRDGVNADISPGLCHDNGICLSYTSYRVTEGVCSFGLMTLNPYLCRLRISSCYRFLSIQSFSTIGLTTRYLQRLALHMIALLYQESHLKFIRQLGFQVPEICFLPKISTFSMLTPVLHRDCG